MKTNDEFIFVSNEQYLKEMGYDSIEDWARDSDLIYDQQSDLWFDDEGTCIDIDVHLAYILDDLTWGWEVQTYALEQEYRMSETGDWVDRKGRYRVDPESELIELFFDDLKADRKARQRRKELNEGL